MNANTSVCRYLKCNSIHIGCCCYLLPNQLASENWFNDHIFTRLCSFLFTKFQLLGPRSPGDTSPYQSHYSLRGEQFRFQLVSLKDSKNLNSMVSLYLYIFIRSASGHWNNDLTVQQNMPQNN